MILPFAIDPEVLARSAFGGEAGLCEHTARGGVRRQTRRLDAMETEAVECMASEDDHGVGHEALPRELLSHPIAERHRRLGHALTNVGQLAAAGKFASLA